MSRIVNGTVIPDVEEGGGDGVDGGVVSTVRSFVRRRTVNIAGFDVPWMGAALGGGLTTLWFGITGLFLFIAVLGVSHFAFGSQGRGGRSGAGGSSGRGQQPGKPNIKGMGDLPKPPPSS